MIESTISPASVYADPTIESLLAAVLGTSADADRLVLADRLEELGAETAASATRALVGAGYLFQDAALAAVMGVAAEAVRAVAPPAENNLPNRMSVERARVMLNWARENEPLVRKAATKMSREADLLTRAASGDVKALLAHPQAREAVRRLARGEKPARHRKRPSDYCGSRKALAAAKAVLAGREQRRADRDVAERARAGRAGRIRAAWLQKLRERCVEIGEQYHREVRSLYASKYAHVAYGRGGQEETDRERYSKGWHRSHGAASCLLAGARLDSEDRPTLVILENFRGTEVARIPLED